MLAADSKVVTATSAGAPTRELASQWKNLVGPVEPFLDAVHERLTRQVTEFDSALGPYAEYALTGQGKHLRPALVALTANAWTPPGDTHITVAVIIEMVHLATLVHDDVMDESSVRRGRPTLAATWGNDIAVLFGDCLFAQALKLAASFPTPEICRAVAVATNTVCSGEILQTQQSRNFDLSRNEYVRILEMKTGELFAVSSDLAAHVSDALPHQRSAARDFGMAFGTAYQIYDDCVDLFGSEAAAGKSLGTDLAKGKLTLPVLLLRERADAGDSRRARELIEHWHPDALGEIGRLLAKYETLAPSAASIHSYLERARQSLRSLPESKGRTGLFKLTEYLARQTDALSVCA